MTPLLLSPPAAQSSLMASPQTEEFFDLIASSQSRRLDDQRANVGNLPGLRITHNNLGHLRVEGDAQEPGDEFFNMLMKCQVLRDSILPQQHALPPPIPPAAPVPLLTPFFSPRSPPGSMTSAAPPPTPSPVAPPCQTKTSSASSSASRPSAWMSRG